jgi:hypothetical protein
MILGASTPPDTIEVEDVKGDEGAFVANFEIPAFQKRMRVSNNIELEFIARGRMWCLAFSIESSKWVVKLSILEHSPATWIDSRLIIEEPPRRSTTVSPIIPSLIDTDVIDEQPAKRSNRRREKPKPAISLRIQTKYNQIGPSGSNSTLNGSIAAIGLRIHNQIAPPGSNNALNGSIVVPLEDSLMGSSLQYDGCSYLDAEGTLRARFEARLAKPEMECIIC